MELRRKEGESRLHFIWRVYSNQRDVGGLTNEKCGEICRCELNETFDESAYRKIAQYFFNMFDEVKHEYLSEESIEKRIEEIDKREDELYKIKVKTSDKLREYRTGLRNNARFDNLQETAIECAKIMSESYPFNNNKAVLKTAEEKVGVLLLSDFHYGIIIDNFLNKYDKKVCKNRVDQIVYETIKTCELNKVDNLKILNLGDLVNGFLHLSSRVENEEDVITQVIEVSEILANLISELSEHFNSIEYLDTLDNHSRCNANKKLSLEEENFGRLVSWYLKPRLSNLKNVSIITERLDDTLVEFDILGESCFAVHGHMDRVGNIVSKLSLLRKQIPMAIFTAHIHHNYEKDDSGVDIIVNGTLSGTDRFAKEMRLTSKPMQKLLVYEKVNDKVKRDITKNIEF